MSQCMFYTFTHIMSHTSTAYLLTCHAACGGVVPVSSPHGRGIEDDTLHSLELLTVHLPVSVQIKHLEGYLKVTRGSCRYV